MVKSIFDNFNSDINIEVDGIDIFENEKYDVVKFNVRSDGSLLELHNKFGYAKKKLVFIPPGVDVSDFPFKFNSTNTFLFSIISF